MIAFFSIAPFLSGSERCLQLMLREASSNGLQPVLVTSHNSPMENWAKENSIDHFSTELNPVKVSSWAYWLTEQTKLTLFLRRRNIRVIHSNQIWSYRAALLPAKLLRAKVVCHFRDPIDFGSRWWLPQQPDLCIFISKFIEMQYYSTFFIRQDQNTVQMMDPIERPGRQSLSEAQRRKTKARELIDIASDKLLFGFIGQVAPVKGLLETIDILSALARDDWMLIVAGEDPSTDQSYLKICLQKARERGISERIKFIGFQEQISTVYEAIDLVIMLSKQEPLGLIPLEAGGFYTPSIVSKVGGLPETVNNGESGWVIDMHDREKAILTIQSITQENLRKKALNARRFTESINDPKQYWQSLIQAYSKSGIGIG